MVDKLHFWVTVIFLGAIWKDVLAVDTPSTTIQAEQGFEWQKGAGRFVAHGNVRVRREHVILNTDTLTVSFHEVKTPAELSWWHALGNTRIALSRGIISGETADYEVHDKILSLSGHPVHIETATETLTAHMGVEYRENQQVAVARGDVHIVIKDGSILQLEIATIYSHDSDGIPIPKIFLIGKKVKIETHRGILCGGRGIYGLDTAIASNSVQVATHSMKMTSERAVVNTKTGLSRFYTALRKSERQFTRGRQERVKLLLLQKRKKNSRTDKGILGIRKA